MPVQVQTNLLSQKLGARIANAHKEHKDTPVDTGIVRLPGGINNGKARLHTMTIGAYKTGTHVGMPFFRAAGVVLEPTHVDGQKVQGEFTSQMIPLCDTPEKMKKKTFADNWADFINVYKMFGIEMPPERLANESDQAAGVRIEQYFLAAAKALTDPPQGTERPVFVFSTREWTPPPKPGQKSSPMVLESWHGMCEYTAVNDPAAGVTDGGQHAPAGMNPEPFTEPPQPQTAPAQGAAPPQSTPPAQQHQPDDSDPADTIALLIATAEGDPSGDTEDGQQAMDQLKSMALAAGATEKQVADAAGWADVGAMALGIMPEAPSQPTAPIVGGIYKFTRRDSKGNPLKNPKTKVAFPPLDIEVIAVDVATSTVTAKGKDGATIVSADKKPTAIKFEYLES